MPKIKYPFELKPIVVTVVPLKIKEVGKFTLTIPSSKLEPLEATVPPVIAVYVPDEELKV